MDSSHFDGLAQTFGRVRSRRDALRGAAAVAAGTLTLGTGQLTSARAPKTNFILSGGSLPTDQLSADDDLKVKLNKKVIFNDNDELASNIEPIAFQARPGNTLRVIAIDTGGCIGVSPLWLHPEGGSARELHPGIAPQGCDEPVHGRFFDEKFEI
jgi:hypothetical protein